MPIRTDFAYPIALSQTGGIALAKGNALTQDRVRAVLETRPREHPLRPNHGLSDQAFTALPYPGVIAERVRQAVELQTGLSPVVETQGTNYSEGVVSLQVGWREQGAGRGYVSDAASGVGPVEYTVQLGE